MARPGGMVHLDMSRTQEVSSMSTCRVETVPEMDMTLLTFSWTHRFMARPTMATTALLTRAVLKRAVVLTKRLTLTDPRTYRHCTVWLMRAFLMGAHLPLLVRNLWVNELGE